MLNSSSIFGYSVWIYGLGTGGGAQGSPALFYLFFRPCFNHYIVLQQDCIQAKLVAKTGSDVYSNQPDQKIISIKLKVYIKIYLK